LDAWAFTTTIIYQMYLKAGGLSREYRFIGCCNQFKVNQVTPGMEYGHDAKSDQQKGEEKRKVVAIVDGTDQHQHQQQSKDNAISCG